MGSQVSFFLTALDVDRLEQALRSIEPFFLVESSSETPEPTFRTSMRAEPGERPVSCYLAREQDLATIRLRHVPDQNRWSVDQLHSRVVEYSGCYQSDELLRAGRLYRARGYWQDAVWIEWPADFVQWADRLIARTRRELAHEPATRDYIGADAQKWLEQPNRKLASI